MKIVIEDLQNFELRPIYERLIQIVFKHLYGKKINHYKFEFKPIMTLSQNKKSEVMESMMRVVDMAYQDGFIAQKDGMKMLTDLLDNPSNIFHNISKDYIEQVENGDENGDIITSNTFKIELAKALNQFQNEQKSLSGVESPESGMRGKNEGGNPKKQQRLLKRHSLNKEKLLEHPDQTKTVLSPYTVDDFVKDPVLKQFYMYDMNTVLEQYEPGRPEHKPKLLEQMKKMEEERAKRLEDHNKMLQAQHKLLSCYNPVNKDIETMRNEYEKKLSDKNLLITELLKKIKQLTLEADQLRKLTNINK